MNKLEIINEHLEEMEIQTLSADGFDDAILGIVTDFNSSERIAYSVTKCIEILMTRDNMSMEDAVEYFDFNVRGAYMGVGTPLWIDDGMFSD